jgi:predicted dehydrogenase
VGVCDANLVLGSKVVSEYEVLYYQKVEDLLGQVNAVSLAVPTLQHFDLVMRCIAQGVHVLVEKPLTEILEQAEQL